MELRSRINTAMKQAMKDKSAERLSTIRLINAAIKDRDIAARTEGKENGVGDGEVLAILAKMTKQRQESAKTYEEAGRLDLSERELAEIKVIEEFLPLFHHNVASLPPTYLLLKISLLTTYQLHR